MTKHSKGDWKVIYGASVVTVADNRLRLIANTGGYQTNFSDELPINEANAKFIAKTPEMYEFVEKIANVFKWDNSTVEIWAEEAKEIVKGIEDG